MIRNIIHYFILALLLTFRLTVIGVEDSNVSGSAVEALTSIKDSRPISPGESNLLKEADLVAIGTVVEVNDLDETNLFLIDGVVERVYGVETIFKISKVVKGKLAGTKITLHHYRLDKKPPKNLGLISFTPENFNFYIQKLLPPGLISFVTNRTNEFVLCLVKDGPHNFRPASGQEDASFSVMALPPPWDFSYIHQANASIREEYHVHVPTKLSVRRIKGILDIQGDSSSLELINLTVGTNMVMGMWCDVFVYPDGLSRPTNHCHNLAYEISPDALISNEIDLNPEPYFWRPDGQSVAVPLGSTVPWVHTHEGGVVAGAKYNLEMDLTIFETDAAKIDSHWNPQTARYYKILWQRSLTQKITTN